MARAPRGGSWKAEYAARIARFERQHPGASRSAARGHSGAGEREADRLLRRLAKLPRRSEIHFAGTDRQPDGTWRRARFDVLGGDGEEQTFTIPEEALGRLPEIRDAIAASGAPTLGGSYLDSMVKWVEENELIPTVYVIESPRGRFVTGVSKRGNAITTADAYSSRTLTSSTHDVERFLRRNRQLVKRGYRIVAL